MWRLITDKLISRQYDKLHKKGFVKNNETHEYNDYEGSYKKFYYVLRYVQVDAEFPILDAGCGKGHYLKEMLANGIPAFGIEFSKKCCEQYLKGLPYKNTDIISYSKSFDHVYGGLICIDVLEHIPPKKLGATIQALVKLSPSAFYGIANHQENLSGYRLHYIRENISWWYGVFKQFYEYVALVIPRSNDTWMNTLYDQQRFFFFHCEGIKKHDT